MTTTIRPGQPDTDPSTPQQQTSTDSRGRKRRLLGLDALRGLVLAVMILTPVTGSNGSYPLLGHAPWNGFTVADAVFPAFLVTSGASLAWLLRPPVGRDVGLRLVRRTIALVVLGVLYNAVGGPLDLSSVRLTGVLQLIGLSGALAAVVVLVSRRLTGSLLPVAVVAVALPLLNGWRLAEPVSCPQLDGRCSPWFELDRAVLGPANLYAGGQAGFDPEGIAVVVAATSLVLFGYVAMAWLRTQGVGWYTTMLVVAAGIVLITLGLWLDQSQPINKRLHTPAFTLLAGGIAVTGLGLATAAWDLSLDGHRLGRVADGGRRLLADPFVTFGRNALVVYVSERLLLVAASDTIVDGPDGPMSLQQHLIEHVIAVEGVRVHLAYTALLLVLILAITYAMRLLRWRIVL